MISTLNIVLATPPTTGSTVPPSRPIASVTWEMNWLIRSSFSPDMTGSKKANCSSSASRVIDSRATSTPRGITLARQFIELVYDNGKYRQTYEYQNHKETKYADDDCHQPIHLEAAHKQRRTGMVKSTTRTTAAKVSIKVPRISHMNTKPSAIRIVATTLRNPIFTACVFLSAIAIPAMTTRVRNTKLMQRLFATCF